MVKYSTIQYRGVQHGKVQYRAVQRSAAWWSAVLYSTVQRSGLQYIAQFVCWGGQEHTLGRLANLHLTIHNRKKTKFIFKNNLEIPTEEEKNTFYAYVYCFLKWVSYISNLTQVKIIFKITNFLSLKCNQSWWMLNYVKETLKTLSSLFCIKIKSNKHWRENLKYFPPVNVKNIKQCTNLLFVCLLCKLIP